MEDPLAIHKRNPVEESQEFQALLVEYQAAQASAEHHDNLIWTATNVIWGASLILLGFILQSVTNNGPRPLIIVLCILGLFLNIFVWISALQYNSVKNQKYRRCKEIEERLGLRQHRDLRYRI